MVNNHQMNQTNAIVTNKLKLLRLYQNPINPRPLCFYSSSPTLIQLITMGAASSTILIYPKSRRRRIKDRHHKCCHHDSESKKISEPKATYADHDIQPGKVSDTPPQKARRSPGPFDGIPAYNCCHPFSQDSTHDEMSRRKENKVPYGCTINEHLSKHPYPLRVMEEPCLGMMWSDGNFVPLRGEAGCYFTRLPGSKHRWVENAPSEKFDSFEPFFEARS